MPKPTALDEAAPSPGIGHNNPPEPYALSPGKLAEAMGLPGDTLDALVRAGKGPPVFKVGRRVFCRLFDFKAWLDDVANGKIDATLTGKRRHITATAPKAKPRRSAERRAAP